MKGAQKRPAIKAQKWPLLIGCYRLKLTRKTNVHLFFKAIHIENDENVIFWFIYLIFIYFYKIKKKYETKG